MNRGSARTVWMVWPLVVTSLWMSGCGGDEKPATSPEAAESVAEPDRGTFIPPIYILYYPTFSHTHARTHALASSSIRHTPSSTITRSPSG